jgi:hypothetical protein
MSSRFPPALYVSPSNYLLSLIPPVALRLVYLAPSENQNPTLSSIVANILTEAALEYALLSTSITALKPFLRPLHSSAVVNSVVGDGSGIYAKSRSRTQGIYLLSSTSGKDKQEEYKLSTVDSGKTNPIKAPEPVFKPDFNQGQTVTSVRRDANTDDMDSMESNSSERMIIRTTRNWSVRYEDK